MSEYSSYIKELQDTLSVHKKLLDCLEKRMVLIHTNYTEKNEYEKNEIEITKIKTQGEIDSIKKVIQHREQYFKTFVLKFVEDAEEMENNYNSVLWEVKMKQEQIKGAKDLLYSINWKNVEEHIEVKIKVYQRLRDLLK